MISALIGLVTRMQAHLIELNVGGVVYEVLMPSNDLAQIQSLDKKDKELEIYTHLIIRDDAHFLVGFLKPAQRDLFRSLIKINGVGPKLALALLSSFSQEQFIQIIQNNDVNAFKKVPGIGAKTAERMLFELSQAFEKLIEQVSVSLTPHSSHINTQAIEALINLGYKPHQAEQIISQTINQNPHFTQVADLVKEALRSHAQHAKRL